MGRLDFSQFVTQAPAAPQQPNTGAWQKLLGTLLQDKQAEERRKLEEQQLAAQTLSDAEARKLRAAELAMRGQEFGRDQQRLSLDRDKFGFDQSKFSTKNEREDAKSHEAKLTKFKEHYHENDYQAEDSLQELRAAGYSVEAPKDAFAHKKSAGGEPGPADDPAEPAPAPAAKTGQPASALEFGNPTDYFSALANKTPGGGTGIPGPPPAPAPPRLHTDELQSLPPGASPEGDIEADARAVEALAQENPDGGTGGAESNRVVIRDPKGNVVFTSDVAEARRDQGARVAAAFAPFIKSAGDPVEKRAAEMGLAHSLELVGTMSMKEAIEKGMAAYRFTVGEEGKTKRVVAGGGVGGSGSKLPSKYEQALSVQDQTQADKSLEFFAQKFNYKSVNDGITALNQLETSLAQDTGYGDRDAIKKQIVATEKRATDADFKVAIGSGGLANELQTAFNYVTGGGELSDEFMANLKKLSRDSRATAIARRKEIGDEAYDSVMNKTYNFQDRERSANWVRGTLTGTWRAPKDGGPAPPGGDKSTGPPAEGKPKVSGKEKFGY